MIPLIPHPQTGIIYATLKGARGQRSRKISLGTTDMAEARRIAAEARFEEIQSTAKANALNAKAIIQLSNAANLTVESAKSAWLESLAARGVRQNTITLNSQVITRWTQSLELSELVVQDRKSVV